MTDLISNVAAESDQATFADLVVADEEWLRAEFDAIISAEKWGEPRPPGETSLTAGLPGEPDRGPTPDDPGGGPPGPAPTPDQPRAAERSPPGSPSPG